MKENRKRTSSFTDYSFTDYKYSTVFVISVSLDMINEVKLKRSITP